MKAVLIAIVLVASFAPAQEVLWQRDGDLEESHFGAQVEALGDQNADGFADWLIWKAAPWASRDFYYGGNPPATDPYMTISGNESGSILSSVLGDFNGDGAIDWMMLFWRSPSDTGFWKFYSGGLNADTIPELVWTMTGFYNPNNTTGRIGTIGDYNGDGYGDFYYYDSRPSDLTTIYLGSPLWDFQIAYMTQGEPIFSEESRPLSTIGDFNGDGFDDYPTWDANITKYYLGSAVPDTTPDLVWNGDFASFATLQVDLNNDGFADLIIHRGASTIDVHLGAINPSDVPSGFLQYDECTSSAPRLWSAGDFNRDGYEDLVMVNYPCNSGFGRIALFAGGSYIRTTPVWEENGTVNGLMVGIKCAIGIGDVNNDGIDDLAVGCENGFNRRGRVVIFSGDTTLILPAEERLPVADNFSLSVYPNPFNSTLSIALDVPLHQEVNVALYDLLGREVEVIYRGRLATNSISYAAPAALPSGVYFVRAVAGSKAVMGKVVLLK